MKFVEVNIKKIPVAKCLLTSECFYIENLADFKAYCISSNNPRALILKANTHLCLRAVVQSH